MDTTLSDPLVGRVLDGRYVVESRIARGGMATVYLATDRRLDRDVALKVMHAHLADNPEFVSRFTREAKSAARLSHPNVVSVFDQGADSGIVFLAMEHLPGRTLRDLLRDRGPLSPGAAFDILEPLLDALAAAHRAGIVHRDVKPENVLLTDDGRVKVADFGLARAASTSTSSATGVLMGTVAYLSPELVERGVADARSDVYAAGILLFEMLTGRQPFEGEVAIQVAYRHVHDEVAPPSSLDDGLPGEVDDLVLWATSRDADERPADAAELLDEVRRVRRELTPQALGRRPPAALAAAAGETLVVERLPSRDGKLTSRGGSSALRDNRLRDNRVHDTTPSSDWGYGPGGRRRRRGAYALIAILALAVVLGATGWYFGAGPGAYQPTPDLVGQTQQAAEAELERDGLGSRVDMVFHEEAGAGTVVSTEPEPGADVRRNARVLLVVSQGPELFTVPESVLGATLEEATAALAAASLVVVEPAAEEYSPDLEAGRVLSVSPEPGTELRRGDEVSLAVSLGPQPVDVPAVVGRPRDNAVDMIEDAGLDAQVSDQQEFDDSVPAGAVLRQDPAQGQLLPGETVTLVLSQGPDLVEVPAVQGRQLDEARQLLEAEGLEVAVDEVLGGIFGTVRSVDPRAGSMVLRGSTVTLRVV